MTGFVKTVLKLWILWKPATSWPVDFLKLWYIWRRTLSLSYGRMMMMILMMMMMMWNIY